MEYELVEIYPISGENLIGFAIKKGGLPKFEGTNIYSREEEQEARDQVQYLNEATALKEFWPFPTDPEVEAILNDPTFQPVGYDDVSVIDMGASTIVYDMKPGPHLGDDESGNPIFGPEEIKYDEVGQPQINWMASDIVRTHERQPRQSDVRQRIEAACEIVARHRLEATIHG